MSSRQASQRRATTPWRALSLVLLLPLPGALAQTNGPAPAMAPAAATPATTAGEPASTPAAPERPDAATDTSGPPTPEAPERQQAPPAAGTSAVPPPAEVRPAAPSRAPGATQSEGQARRRRASPAPEASAGELQAPRPRQESTSPAGEWSQPDEDFGRWERSTEACDIELAEPEDRKPERLTCRSVRLDQQLAGLLSIRFLPAAPDAGATAQQLLFAGVLLPGSQPMRCQDSRCEPSWPIRVQVSALATSNARTLGLPQARVVQGSCSVEKSRVLCQARDLEGRRWQAKGRW